MTVTRPSYHIIDEAPWGLAASLPLSAGGEQLDRWQSCYKIAEKSSKIVPLGAPLLYSFALKNLRKYPSARLELRSRSSLDAETHNRN